jgi:tRNA nucleotidyltransferase (CCA-adding enzyme)
MLAVNGKALLEAGFAPGPGIGKALDFLLEHVIENPGDNTARKLIELAGGLSYQGGGR